MHASLKSVKINLPFGIGGATIAIDQHQQRAAWALYVEMATRVTAEDLDPGAGSARKALNSLYSLFETTLLSAARSRPWRSQRAGLGRAAGDPDSQ